MFSSVLLLDRNNYDNAKLKTEGSVSNNRIILISPKTARLKIFSAISCNDRKRESLLSEKVFQAAIGHHA